MLPNYVMGYTLFDETANVEDIIQEFFLLLIPKIPAWRKNI
jgi:hypothetical protein